MEWVRANKFLAQSGVCSRRDADKLLEQGLVTINGKVAGPGDRICENDEVLLRGKPLKVNKINEVPERVVIAYYKPVGVVCTEKDKHAAKKVTDFIKTKVRVTYAGRLDKDSEGLLLLTNDGGLIDGMMRGSHYHEKEYIVKVNKQIDKNFIDKMASGVYLKELDCTTRFCEVTKIGPYTFRIVLTQGLNRQIRRMCEALGYQVKSLKRVRVMNITLDKLTPGQYRELNSQEIHELVDLVKNNHQKA